MIQKAFILGAGLGTRLRPLTNHLPKPLVPIFHEPMANHALRHCQRAGITQFAINTHHIPNAWETTYPNGQFNGCPIELFHEPTLLDTGGGLRNIAPFIGNDTILVYNGDIHTNIDLIKLITHHEASGNIATLALRSNGDNRNVNTSGDLITDMRNLLGNTPGTHQFTGIYCIRPEILRLIPNAEKQNVVSIIPTFIRLIQQKKLGAITLDNGHWFDIGTPSAYHAIHNHLRPNHPHAIHPDALIHPTAQVDPKTCVIGPGATIEANTNLTDTIVWPGANVPAGTRLHNTIITAS